MELIEYRFFTKLIDKLGNKKNNSDKIFDLKLERYYDQIKKISDKNLFK